MAHAYAAAPGCEAALPDCEAPPAEAEASRLARRSSIGWFALERCPWRPAAAPALLAAAAGAAVLAAAAWRAAGGRGAGPPRGLDEDQEGPPLYIFGYGSLLSRFSTFKTDCGVVGVTAEELESLASWAMLRGGPAGSEVGQCVDAGLSKPFILVKAIGVRRGWYAPGVLAYEKLSGTVYTAASMAEQALDVSPTYLGAVADPAAECYGVIYPVTEEELRLSDEREAAADYSPGFLGAGDLEVLDGSASLPADVKVRWYPMLEGRAITPTPLHPIVQSYVDLFVGGALQLEERSNVPDYALRVIASTFDWSKHWINDRITPYRPFVKAPLASRITAALQRASLVENSTLDASHLMAISFR